jgi:arylsulfatase A-like enzyme
MTSQINRRDFLKLATLLSLSSVQWPSFMNEPNDDSANQNAHNVLILVFDALSADNVSFFGYERDTTPNLERFAKNSTVYYNNHAGGNFTSSGTASLLTGTYPWTHRAIHLHGTVSENLTNRNIFNLFSSNGYFNIAYSHNLLVTSLLNQFRDSLDEFPETRELCLADDEFADRLFPNDYNAAFWSEWLTLRGGETPPSSLYFSMFHRMLRYARKRMITGEYGDLFPKGVPNLHNLFFILEDAIDWIIAQLGSLPQPYLAYFHLLPPHEPYLARKDFIDRFDDDWVPVPKPTSFATEGHSEEFLNYNRREYDEFLAYADSEFGRLYDYMLRAGVLDDTYVILTSDHGELFERGIRGHVTPVLFQPVINVPLIISKPGHIAREDVFTPVSNIDILPTMLHATGQQIPNWCEGDILPTFGKDSSYGKEVYAIEAKSNPKFSPLTKGTVAMVKDEYKFIYYLNNEETGIEFELYNLQNDPEERVDLSVSNQALAAELKNILISKLQDVG